MQPFTRLFIGAGGVHAAEQFALAALPLTAVLVLGADPGLVGLLVAAQGAAWLLVTLPGGVLIDRWGAGRVVVTAPWLSVVGSLAAAGAAVAGQPIVLAAGAFVAASGTVLFTLAAQATIPLVVTGALAVANGRIELARAVSALAAPLAVGGLASIGAVEIGFILAAASGLIAARGARRLTIADTERPARAPIWAAMRAGAGFAWSNALLRGVLVCALFWNFAFFALMAIFVPYALTVLGQDAGAAAFALSAYGAGLVIGAAGAARVITLTSPRAILVGGPALSLAAALVIAGNGPTIVMFLVGFGPMLWFVCQTSLRQSVTPPALLGRVNATILVAIYGVRPLGALAGGGVAAWAGLEAAMALVIVAFGLSLASVLASPLARLAAMPARAALVAEASRP